MKIDKKNIIVAGAGLLIIWSLISIESDDKVQTRTTSKNSFEKLEAVTETDNKVNREVIEDKLTLDTFGSGLGENKPELEVVSNIEVKEEPIHKPEEKNIIKPVEQTPNNNKSLWSATEETPVYQETKPVSHAEKNSNSGNNQAVRVSYKSTNSQVVEEIAQPAPRPKRGQFAMSDYFVDTGKSKYKKLEGSDNFTEGKLLKNGSKYIGVIEEPMRVIDGEPQHVEIMVLGKLSPHSVSIPFLLTGKAKLNKDKTRIQIEVSHCVDPRSNSKSVPCKGVIRDSEGFDGVGGVTTSPWYRALVVRVVSSIFSGMLLTDLTRSVTQNGTLIDQTRSNQVLQGLADGTKTAGEESAKRMESTGDSILVDGPSLVQVRIIEDTELW